MSKEGREMGSPHSNKTKDERDKMNGRKKEEKEKENAVFCLCFVYIHTLLSVDQDYNKKKVIIM